MTHAFPSFSGSSQQPYAPSSSCSLQNGIPSALQQSHASPHVWQRGRSKSTGPSAGSYETNRIRVIAGELKNWTEQGYSLIPGSSRDEERAGLPTITTVEVEGEDVCVLKLSHEEIAERMGKSVRQVRSLIESGNRKLRLRGLR